jgi:hypothetical protein
MVVLVFITSCQVLEKSKSGPLVAQRTTTRRASKKAAGAPTALLILEDIR